MCDLLAWWFQVMKTGQETPQCGSGQNQLRIHPLQNDGSRSSTGISKGRNFHRFAAAPPRLTCEPRNRHRWETSQDDMHSWLMTSKWYPHRGHRRLVCLFLIANCSQCQAEAVRLANSLCSMKHGTEHVARRSTLILFTSAGLGGRCCAGAGHVTSGRRVSTCRLTDFWVLIWL